MAMDDMPGILYPDGTLKGGLETKIWSNCFETEHEHCGS